MECRTPVRGNASLTLSVFPPRRRLLSPSLTSCQLDADALLQLQSNMFNTFLDKMKVMSDDEIDKMVLALPNAIWNPEIARPFPFPVLFLDEFAIISWS